MAIDKETMALIDAICDSDMSKARACAIAVLDSDTAKSRETWRKLRVNRLKAAQTLLSSPVPRDLEGMLVVEDSHQFRAGRYVLGRPELDAVDYVSNMRAATRALLDMGIRYPVTLLLHGEPGVGKTMLARYIAMRLDLPFAYVSFSRLVESHMGATSRNIARIVGFASAFPCVLTLDEVDTIAVTRGAGDGAEKELGRVSVTLMQELDRIPSTMVLVACTNRPDVIDPALLRRFNKHVQIVRPASSDEVYSVASAFLDDCGQAYDPTHLRSVVSRYDRPDTDPWPTQDQIVKTLVEDLARHVLDGKGTHDPVSLGHLGRLVNFGPR